MKYILRIIALPFWIALSVIYLLVKIIRESIYFVRYGGEMMTFIEKDTPKKIWDIWTILNDERKGRKNE